MVIIYQKYGSAGRDIVPRGETCLLVSINGETTCARAFDGAILYYSTVRRCTLSSSTDRPHASSRSREVQ